VLRAPWPVSDPELAKEDELEIPVQINGKLVTVVRVAADADPKTLKRRRWPTKSAVAHGGKTVVKVIVVPGKGREPGGQVNIKAPPLRGTQSLVGQMGWVFRRPSLTAIEMAWRWLFGMPFLLVCWVQAQQILAALPLESAGLNGARCAKPVGGCGATWPTHGRSTSRMLLAVLRWLAPMAALAWVVVSALGRSLVLKRLEPRLRFDPCR
jgi:hypothetical protein